MYSSMVRYHFLSFNSEKLEEASRKLINENKLKAGKSNNLCQYICKYTYITFSLVYQARFLET